MGNTVDKLHPEWVDKYNKLKCVSNKMFSYFTRHLKQRT